MKRRPKLIIYNVSKLTVKEVLKEAVDSQSDVPNDVVNEDNKVLFNMKRKNGT